MIGLKFLRASDGTGAAVLAHVTLARNPGATTLKVDNLDNWPSYFIATTGQLNAAGYITEATKKEFYGHIVSGDIVIDSFCPGFTDTGNTTQHVVILKQTTSYADNVQEALAGIMNDDGTAKNTILDNFYKPSEINVQPFVASGGIVALTTGLTGSFSDIVFYIAGLRYSKTGVANKVYTASKDTYVDIDNTGTVYYTEVANNAASPALTAGRIRIAKVVTNGSTITSVVQYDRDSLYNLIRPTSNAANQPLFLQNTAGSITFTAPFDGVLEVAHSFATWGFAGNAYGLEIVCNNNAVKLSGTRSYVTGSDTVGRQAEEEAVFTNIVKGQSYTVSLSAWVGSGGGVVANSERMVAKLTPR